MTIAQTNMSSAPAIGGAGAAAAEATGSSAGGGLGTGTVIGIVAGGVGAAAAGVTLAGRGAPPVAAFSIAPDGAGIRRRLSRLLVLPAAPAALRLRYVTPNPYRAECHQSLVAVVPLVGDNLFNPRTVRLHQLHLLGRHDQRLRQRRRIAVRCILHRHRDDGSRVHVDPVLGLVGHVRPTVLHLRDLRVRVLRRFPLLVRRLLVLPRPVEPSQIRPRRCLHPGRLRQTPHERLVGFARVPPLDAPHRRVRFQRRRIDADRLAPHQPRVGEPLQHPRENRHVRLHVDPPPRARQRRVVRRRLGHVQVQKRPQTQRIGHPPRDPPLGGQPFEIADDQQTEIPARP